MAFSRHRSEGTDSWHYPDAIAGSCGQQCSPSQTDQGLLLKYNITFFAVFGGLFELFSLVVAFK